MNIKFPNDFLFGIGSSSYQIEGAHDKDGKGESIWDRYTETHKELIVDGSDGKDACKSYEFYEDDVQALKDLQVQFYRFSISWCRICPDGDSAKLNQSGIAYYNNLINLLIDSGIEPMVTIYHWDLPQKLQDLGGWTNPKMADFFEDYARVIFTLYGDRVKWWFTINEPHLHSVFSYGQCLRDKLPVHAPDVRFLGISEYLAGHVMLLSHARAYRLYQKEFYSKQRGKVGIVLDAFNFIPASNKIEDINAAKRTRTFEVEWLLHPIFSSTGDYPPLMKKIINEKSLAEGRTRSRLPELTADEIELIKGSSDFLGINHYTTYLAADEDVGDKPSFYNDAGFNATPNPNSFSPSPDWIKMEPEGFLDLLNWIKNTYNNPPVFITENGCGDVQEYDDKDKIYYHKTYLQVILKAINEDGCKIIGYSAWSLLDSFEWSSGYTEKFGFYRIDFTDPKRKRTPKRSASYYRNVIKTRSIDFKFPD
ncbi:myrosinase 1 [Lycorma delicatula]|uniref:myrosinase 1 n=1 Tax=Lycorma delicatula TaxID=130591 RepID=UPI003F50E4C4